MGNQASKGSGHLKDWIILVHHAFTLSVKYILDETIFLVKSNLLCGPYCWWIKLGKNGKIFVDKVAFSFSLLH